MVVDENKLKDLSLAPFVHPPAIVHCSIVICVSRLVANHLFSKDVTILAFNPAFFVCINTQYNRMAFRMRMRCWCGGNVQGVCPGLHTYIYIHNFISIRIFFRVAKKYASISECNLK